MLGIGLHLSIIELSANESLSVENTMKKRVRSQNKREGSGIVYVFWEFIASSIAESTLIRCSLSEKGTKEEEHRGIGSKSSDSCIVHVRQTVKVLRNSARTMMNAVQWCYG